MNQYVVTFTSMVVDAESPDEAIERAQESHGGGSWDATPVDAPFAARTSMIPGVYPAQEYDLPGPGEPFPHADVWLWQVGDRWIASVKDHEFDTWWDGDTPESHAAPDPWWRPLDETPSFGLLVYRIKTADGFYTATEVPAELGVVMMPDNFGRSETINAVKFAAGLLADIADDNPVHRNSIETAGRELVRAAIWAESAEPDTILGTLSEIRAALTNPLSLDVDTDDLPPDGYENVALSDGVFVAYAVSLIDGLINRLTGGTE